jgi:ribonuclease P/MRP protein subunit POP8
MWVSGGMGGMCTAGRKRPGSSGPSFARRVGPKIMGGAQRKNLGWRDVEERIASFAVVLYWAYPVSIQSRDGFQHDLASRKYNRMSDSEDVHSRTFQPRSNIKQKERSVETTFTFRHPPYAYIYLIAKSLSTNTQVDLDTVTAQLYLRSALSQFLGLTGTAIQLDLMKVQGRDIWLRVARQDASSVVAALSQWASTGQGVSLQVKARGTWLGAVMAKGKLDHRLWRMER